MKNLTRFFTTFLCLFLSFPAFTQIDFKHFPIDSFKLPDIEWKGLSLNGSLNGDYGYLHDVERDQNINESNLFSNAALQYSGLINRTDVQTSYHVNIIPFFDIHKENRDFSNLSLSETKFHLQASSSWSRLKYKGSSFFQLGLSPSASYNTSHERNVLNTLLTNNKQSGLTFSVKVPVGFGKGRIEPVSDVVMALFLLQDAVAIGLDPNRIQQQDVFAFGQLMASVRNQRVFDLRRKRITEFRTLYDFMLDKGWVLPDDPGFFTVLTDNWLYNLNYLRQSGNRWTYLLTPAFSYGTSHNESLGQLPGNFVNNSYGAEASIAYGHYKPQSPHRDFHRIHRMGIDVTNDVFIFPSSDFFPKSKFINRRLHGSFSNTMGYGWFPNSRTQIITDANFTYHYYNDVETNFQEPTPDHHQLSLDISGECNYFLSYLAQLSLNASIGYSHYIGRGGALVGGNFFSFNRHGDRINTTLNASLSVYLY